jgi:hypothetical protein
MSHSQFQAIIAEKQMGTERPIFPQFGEDFKNTQNMFGSTMRGKANKNPAYQNFKVSVTRKVWRPKEVVCWKKYEGGDPKKRKI